MSSAWSQGVLQPQRDRAGDAVAGDDVEVGEVGDDLQQRAHLDVLEVQAQLLAAEARALHQLVRVDLHRPHFEHELVVGLVGAVLPRTLGLDHHAHAVAALEGGHGLHRRAEVGHVEAAAQLLGQRRAQNSTTRLCPCWRMSTPTWVLGSWTMTRPAPCSRGGSRRRATPSADRSAPARTATPVSRRAAGAESSSTISGCPASRRVVGGWRRFSTSACARRLGDVGRTHVALVQFHRVPAQAVAHARQVDGHARRRLHGKAARHGRQRLAQLDAHDIGAGLLRTADRLDQVLCNGRERGGECERQHGGFGAPLVHHAVLQGAFHRAFSCSCREAGRSIHSPAASCTISRRSTWVSVILTMRP